MSGYGSMQLSGMSRPPASRPLPGEYRNTEGARVVPARQASSTHSLGIVGSIYR